MFTPIIVGCETEEAPAIEDETDLELEQEPDFDDVEDADPPIQDPALDELDEDNDNQDWQIIKGQGIDLVL